MKLDILKSGGKDVMNAKLEIRLMGDDWSPEDSSISVPIRTMELSFCGHGIFKVLISGDSQVRTGYQHNRPASVEKILASCDLAEQYGEVKQVIMDFLSEHFGPVVPSSGTGSMAIESQS